MDQTCCFRCLIRLGSGEFEDYNISTASQFFCVPLAVPEQHVLCGIIL